MEQRQLQNDALCGSLKQLKGLGQGDGSLEAGAMREEEAERKEPGGGALCCALPSCQNSAPPYST